MVGTFELFGPPSVGCGLAFGLAVGPSAHGKTITIMGPIVRTFIEHNLGYTDLIDPRGHRPG
jgi:hypothetical protein